MNKQEIDRKIKRLQRLVQQAEAAELASASRLGLCVRAVAAAEEQLTSLNDYQSPVQETGLQLNPALLGNDRRFMSSVNRARDAQTGLVDQYRRQAQVAEKHWLRDRTKLDVLMRALAAMRTQQRQELARTEQNIADELVSQAVPSRSIR